jgi:hypothetical protein
MCDQKIKQELKDVYQQGNISFFLGAGISKSNGIPTWNELVTAMYFRYMDAESWGKLSPYPNYLYAASRRYIKRLEESPEIIIRKIKLGWKDYQHEYDQALWNSLYNSRQTNEVIDEYTISNIPQDIAHVIKSPSRSKVKSVITYNFDDILEETLQRFNFNDYTTVYEKNTVIKPGNLPVFHVHGYVPFNNNPDKNNYGNIILGEDDYNNLMNDTHNWANLIQLTTLLSSVNIMIGLSLTDRNLRRILDITSQQGFNSLTYIFLKRPGNITFSKEEIAQIDLEARELLDKWFLGGGIKPKSGMPVEVEQILNGIMQNDLVINNMVLKQMKVTPIWVDDFREISDYLNFMNT